MSRAEDEKSLAGLLRHELRRRKPAEECPDADRLAGYFEGGVEERERATLEMHFSDCTRCREALAMLARTAEETVEEFAAVAAAAATPLRAAASAPAQATRERARSSWWNWNWRLAVPLAALAILTVWMTRSSTPVSAPGQIRENPTVASNTSPAPSANPAENLQERRDLREEPAGNPQERRSRTRAAEKANIGGAAEDKTSRGASGRMATPPAAIESEAPRGVSAGVAGAAPEIIVSNGPQNKKAKREESQAAEADQMVSVQTVPPAAETPAPPRPAAAPGKGIFAGGASKSMRAAPLGGATGQGGVAVNATAQSSLRETAEGEIIVRSPDPAVLWRVTRAGLIERSFDTGGGWNEQGTTGSAEILTGSAPSAEVCWLVGRNGAVLRTADGRNWQTVKFPEKLELVSVVAQDAQIANVESREGRKFFTHDGGKAWQERK